MLLPEINILLRAFNRSKLVAFRRFYAFHQKKTLILNSLFQKIPNTNKDFMFKINLFLVIITAIMMAACQKDGFSGTEDEQIESYIKSKNLTITEKTASGLRFILTSPNAAGAKLSTGQTVSVKYAGRLLNDKQFDAGTFSFRLGVGQVVGGFDEGIAKLKVGEKGTIIFPSSLGYGSAGAGRDIPGNSPLVFDIEILSAR